MAALTDLMGGRADLMFVSADAAIPYVQSGKLRALAVSSPQRLEGLPGVPTFAEVGFTTFDVRDWAGIVAPRSLPAGAVAPLNAAIVKAFAEPGVKERFAQIGTYVHTGTPAEFDAADPIRAAEVGRGGEVGQHPSGLSGRHRQRQRQRQRFWRRTCPKRHWRD